MSRFIRSLNVIYLLITRFIIILIKKRKKKHFYSFETISKVFYPIMGYLLKIIVAVSHFSKGVIGYTLYRKTIKPEELRLRYDTYINSWDLLTVNHWVQ